MLFYSQFRRQRASHIFIHAAGNGGADTECLVINLSSEPIHILCSVATYRDCSVQVEAASDQEMSIQARSKQGPLETGELLSLGRFDSLMKELKSACGDSFCDDEEYHRLEIKVAAIHGLSDRPVGAVRGFVYDNAMLKVVPDMAHTEQKRTRLESKQVRRWMIDCGTYRETEDP